MCMFMYMSVQMLKGFKSPGVAVIGGCELSDVGVGRQIWVSERAVSALNH